MPWEGREKVNFFAKIHTRHVNTQAVYTYICMHTHTQRERIRVNIIK